MHLNVNWLVGAVTRHADVLKMVISSLLDNISVTSCCFIFILRWSSEIGNLSKSLNSQRWFTMSQCIPAVLLTFFLKTESDTLTFPCPHFTSFYFSSLVSNHCVWRVKGSAFIPWTLNPVTYFFLQWGKLPSPPLHSKSSFLLAHGPSRRGSSPSPHPPHRISGGILVARTWGSTRRGRVLQASSGSRPGLLLLSTLQRAGQSPCPLLPTIIQPYNLNNTPLEKPSSSHAWPLEGYQPVLSTAHLSVCLWISLCLSFLILPDTRKHLNMFKETFLSPQWPVAVPTLPSVLGKDCPWPNCGWLLCAFFSTRPQRWPHPC